jgi:hypothetical protein
VQYKFGDKLHALLESTGAKYLHVDEFCANSQVNSAEIYVVNVVSRMLGKCAVSSS